jgi:hypothetical protein
MIDETKVIEEYPSIKVICDSMERIGNTLDICTERINKVALKSAISSANECKSARNSAMNSAISSATECNLVQNSAKVVQSSAIALDEVQSCTKEVQNSAKAVQNEWEKLGISRRTYYYRKKKGGM